MAAVCYNVHLLTGKISEPGNGPFSLTGQPSACGTAREIGTFAHCLPTAMWIEKEGAYGNAERRTQFCRQQIAAPGESRSDVWQIMEFSKRFKVEDVWPEELIAQKPDYRGKTLFDILYANGEVDKYGLVELQDGFGNHESEHFGFYVQKGLFEEYAQFGRGKAHDLADFETYHQSRGLRWPVVDGKETLPRGLRSLRQGGRGGEFLWQA